MRTMTFSAVMLGAALSAAPLSYAMAQQQQMHEGTAGGGGGMTATPTYPPGAGNPAIEPKLRGTATNVPPAQNPRETGATGHVVVPGNRSSIAGDRGNILEQRTGSTPGQAGNGSAQ